MTEIKGITKQALKNLLGGFLIFAFLIIFFILLGAPSYSEMSRIGTLYTLYFNVFVMLTYAISFVTCYLRVYIAFGSTRRNLFRGKNIVALGLICIVNIVDMIVYVIFDKMELTRAIGSFIMCILILAVGEILSLIINKYGMKGYIISCMLGGFVGGLCGAGVFQTSLIRKYLQMPIVCLSIFAGSIIIYAIINYFEWKMIYKYEIRA
ncbi:MAG: hypothetical protein SPL51_09210 [Lachnospiraceae bacterium]|nr:hypothetical protein [Lachnospiraceae bacterium]